MFSVVRKDGDPSPGDAHVDVPVKVRTGKRVRKCLVCGVMGCTKHRLTKAERDDIFDTIVVKAEVHHIRTASGAKRFKGSIGDVIVGKLKLRNLTVVPSEHPGYEKYHGSDGKDYYVAPQGGYHFVLDATGKQLFHDTTESGALRQLNKQLSNRVDTTAAPRLKVQRAARATATGGKVKAWQTPWNKLSAEDKTKLISMRGRVPERNPLTKEPWTRQAIAKKRQGRTVEGQIAAAQRNGWRLVTSDQERHQLGIDTNKPIPPGWSHVFVYEGPGAESRQYTVQGLAWDYKFQPHQTAAKRGDSLAAKDARVPKMVKRFPALDRTTAADMAKGSHVAAVVRVMMLSGGRVDSNDGKNVTGSRGITSLLGKDVTVKGDVVTLHFPAKSGHDNTYVFRDKVLAAYFNNNKVSHNEQWFPDVNSGGGANGTGAYIKRVAGPEFINHDVRSAVANIVAAKYIAAWLKQHGSVNVNDQKAVDAVVRQVSEHVGVAINDGWKMAYNSYITPATFGQLGIPLTMLPKRGAM